LRNATFFPESRAMNAQFRSFVAVLFACLAAAAANAQPFPSKPVHILVPFPPGGAADLLTRALGKKLSEA
jgi:tripartite-type tricarboxylate transporter receptor subunit TctC